MKNKAIKVICLLLLIPILGIGLPFGGAYLYGRIRYAEKRHKVVSILEMYEHELLDSFEHNNSTTIEDLGFDTQSRTEEGIWFELPYSGKLGGWVPCGLLYSGDVSGIDHWIHLSHIVDNWYFFWEE